MALPEKKVKELIALMNSKSTASVPAAKPIIEMFGLAMNEKVLDYLLKAGQDVHTIPELEEIYHEMYGGDSEEWQLFWENSIKKYSFFHPYDEKNRELYELSPIFPGWVEFTVAGPLTEERAAIINKFMSFWRLLKKVNYGPIRYLTNLKGEKKLERGDAPRIGNVINKGREVVLNQSLETQQQVIFPAMFTGC